MQTYPAPESRLVLLAAGPPRADDRIRAVLAEPIDARAVALLAELENAAALVLARLRALGAVTHELEAALAPLAMVAEFRQARVRAALGDALDSLVREGIRPILLKGAALAAAHYPRFQDRPMRDLDLLVRPEEAGRAFDVLRRDGWHPGPAGADAAAFERYRDHHHLPGLEDPRRTGVGLELHTALLPAAHPFRYDMNAVRAAATEIEFDGRPARVPAPLDLALHACLHFAWSHLLHGAAFRTFRDLRTIVADPRFDWDAFAGRARATRAAAPCYWTIRLANLLSEAGLPESTAATLRPRMPRALERAIERHYACDLLPVGFECPSTRLRYLLWSLAMQPRSHGHGAARPWQFSPLPAPRARRRRFRLHAAGALARYVRTILARGSPYPLAR